MPDDHEILISTHCVQNNSGMFGFLSVSAKPHDSNGRLYCIGSVDIPWPIEAISKDSILTFVPPEDDLQTALWMRRQQQYPQFLAAIMANGGISETLI